MSAFKDSGHLWWQQCQRCRMAWYIGDKPDDVDADVTCAVCDAEDLRVTAARAEGFAQAREQAATDMRSARVRDVLGGYAPATCDCEHLTSFLERRIRAMQPEVTP